MYIGFRLGLGFGYRYWYGYGFGFGLVLPCMQLAQPRHPNKVAAYEGA